MEFIQLKSFVTVAQKGNLTKAAEFMFYSQSAISAHIKTLEEELNVSLFHRTNSGMKLTNNGKILLFYATNIIDAYNEMQLQSKMLHMKVSDKLSIGLNADAVFLKLGPFIDKLKKGYPHVQTNVVGGDSRVLLKKTVRGVVDGTFFFGENNFVELESVKLTNIKIYLVGSIKWRDKILNEDLDELVKLPWVDPGPDCPYSDILKKMLSEVDLQPEWNSTSREVYVNDLIKSGAGLGLLMEEEARSMINQGLMTIWPMRTFKLPVGFAYLRKRKKEPDIKAMKEIIIDLFSK